MDRPLLQIAARLSAALSVLSALTCVLLASSWRASYVGLGIRLWDEDASNGRPGGYVLTAEQGMLFGSYYDVAAATTHEIPLVPVWFATAVPPLLGLVELVRFPRLGQLRRAGVSAERRGSCPCCGYDLRATPDRCPECGMRPDQASEGAASADVG